MKNALIIGYGSIGRKHFTILKKLNYFENIYVFSKTREKLKNKIYKKIQILKLDPDYIIISNETNKHLEFINFIEKNFRNKLVLVEKPFLSKYNKLKLKKNKYYVGYNLRFHPIIEEIKKIIYKSKLWSISIRCHSYLPYWRKNINYSNSSSAKKKFGGGILRDLSHEIDYLYWFVNKLNLKFSYSKKISNLKINTDDTLYLFAIGKNNVLVNVQLNYYSKFPKRDIIITGPKIHLEASIIKNKIKLLKNNKNIKKKFHFNMNETYLKMHTSILQGNTKNICKVNEAYKTLSLINEIQK